LISKPELLAMSADFTARLDPDQVFMISAAQGDGVPDLKQSLAEAMPEGPWLYPEDEVSDATDRMIAAELTREQVVNQLHQELPYATAIETETWEDRSDGSTEIRQQILVERDSQKAIVIGKGGRRLKTIGAAARAQISQHLGRPVHLFLHVKVNPRWDEDRGLYRDIGLEWAD
jgi:GTP-binding protein Era